MITVYVSGPYSSDPEKNTNEAIDIGSMLISNGFAPYVPHLSHFMDVRHKQSYDTWLNVDLAFVRKCDALYRFDGESPGAEVEVSEAIRYDVPVFYDLIEMMRKLRNG